MSWHREDWAKLGTGTANAATGFVEWFKAHPTIAGAIAILIVGIIIGAILF